MKLLSVTPLLVATVFLIACASGTNAAEPLTEYERNAVAAKMYSDAYATRDFDTVKTLLAEDAVFSDPSNHYEGRDAIIEGFNSMAERYVRSGPETREVGKFRSGNSFVYVAFVDFTLRLPDANGAEKEFRFLTDFAIVLDVAAGKITRHTDYVDTEAFTAQLQAQMAE